MKLVLLATFLAAAASAQLYDVVLANGRLMDPESNLDAIRNIGIRGSRVATVSTSPLQGRTVIDIKGLVVTAGFIDLHCHERHLANYAFKARDGVTTALELEKGVNPVSAWYGEREGKALINFGATSGHIPARIAVMHDSGDYLPRDSAANRAASAEERNQILTLIRQGLDEGGLGIGMGLAYTPRASRDEIFELFELAAARRVPVFVHVRSPGPVEPGVIDALQEVLTDALATGAALHVVHVTSMGLAQTPLLLKMIAGARMRGLDVTTEAYPYTAGQTDISSALFDEGWQAAQGGINYGDLQWAATGERLTADSFARYRKQGGLVIIHSIPEEIARLAVADPLVAIASDGRFENGVGHPREAGTFARVLARYVREQRALTLMEALRKMSLMPAQRLGIQSKGRLQVGSDADITVFDPEGVRDMATFEKPAQYSEGIPYVLVGGVFVVRDGKVVDQVSPGHALRR
jgi:dihydroorotase